MSGSRVERIKGLLTDGYTVNFATSYNVAQLTKKHIDMIKEGPQKGSILLQRGKSWIDYSFSKITYF